MATFENKGAMAATILVAASDSLNKAAANYVCDGVADNIEIQAAIDAVVAAGGGSVKLLDGLYQLSAGIDFAGLVDIIDNFLFDARGTTIKAYADMTSLINIAPLDASSKQIIAAGELKFGSLNGRKGSQTVNYGIYIRNCSYIKISATYIGQFSGDGVYADCSGTPYAGTFCNSFDIGAILSNNGIGFRISSNNGVLEFQGNYINIGALKEGTDGVVCGQTDNYNANYNTFIIRDTEDHTGYGCRDRCGGNIWNILYSGVNTIAGFGCPSGLAKKSYINGYFADTVEDAAILEHLFIKNGVFPYQESLTNLINNGDFLIGDPPANFSLQGAGASVARSTAHTKIGSYSAALTRSGTDCNIWQPIPDYAQYLGKTVTLGCWVWASVAARGYISLRDSVIGATYSDAHPGDSQWHWLTVTVTINAASLYIYGRCNVLTGDTTVWFSGLTMLPGSSALVFAPLSTALKNMNSGSATVLNTTTSIVVAHGLPATPTRIQITPRENPTNAVSFWWVDTVGAANFTINVNADPGASNLDFDWHAQVGEG